MIAGLFFLTVFFIHSFSSGQPASQTNASPHITSRTMTEASGGIPYCYKVAFTDPDGPLDTAVYSRYPSWLMVEADSLYGVPPPGAKDTTFLVIISDGLHADTARVAIAVNPTIIVYGDSRTNAKVHRRIIGLIVRQKPQTVFHTGDLVEDGNRSSDWETFNAITSAMRAESEFYPALGNHEHQSPLFFSDFELPNNEQWYSVNRNRIHFIVLNSCVPTDTSSKQYHWLEADLARISDSTKFIAAVFHHPPFSSGSHREDEKGLRQTLVPLFERYGVAIVFNGHDHSYERLQCDSIYYIVTGGGGAPLSGRERVHPCSKVFRKIHHYCKVSRVDDRMIVRVFDIDSQLIDQFEITR